MVTFRETLSRRNVRIGLALLVLALVLALVAMRSYERGFSINGTITNGTLFLSPRGSAVVVNSTLVLSGNGTVMVTVKKAKIYTLNGTSSVVIHARNPPLLSTFNSSVSYRYTGTEAVYPYSNLSIPAFVFMIAGTVIMMMEATRFVREVRKERNAKKGGRRQ